MTRTVSIGSMIWQIDGLRGTKDLSEWEAVFITSVVFRFEAAGNDSSVLSEKQLGIVERIWQKHFA